MFSMAMTRSVHNNAPDALAFVHQVESAGGKITVSEAIYYARFHPQSWHGALLARSRQRRSLYPALLLQQPHDKSGGGYRDESNRDVKSELSEGVHDR
jgi:hypothetical protein